SPVGPAEGDLVFVTGHPGTTNRLDTVAKLRHRRDATLPFVLNRVRQLEALLEQFSGRGPEQAKMARQELHSVANARKALNGQYQGLLDPVILARKAEEEKALRDKLAADPEKQKAYGDAWKRIEAAERELEGFEKLFYLLERPYAFDGELFGIARHLVR